MSNTKKQLKEIKSKLPAVSVYMNKYFIKKVKVKEIVFKPMQQKAFMPIQIYGGSVGHFMVDYTTFKIIGIELNSVNNFFNPLLSKEVMLKEINTILETSI